MTKRLGTNTLALWALGAMCALDLAAQATTTVETTTADGVAVYGERYFGVLDETSPLILLFHQGGSNGRGEYSDLAAWLNTAGHRAIAWDQRSGGERYGRTNRTADGLKGGVSTEYCDAHSDLQAALDYVLAEGLAERVVLWGSSYSGALVFRLAAENPSRVSGVVAFSPAAGGPMVECQARAWVGELLVPVAVFRPGSEMDLESALEQRDILSAEGADFHVIQNGVHGSSMLLDSRTGHDMASARETLLKWLLGLS